MVAAIGQGVEAGRSLKSLVNGFVLTTQTESKSHRTVEFYSENLKRFLWYASRQGWSDDIRMVTQWHVREFLGYLANEKRRWGLEGNGSESSQAKVSQATLHHYFVVLANFFNWAVREGFVGENPTAKVKVAKPKAKVVKPYAPEEIGRIIGVCEHDYEHSARFLGSRNKAIILVLVDSGVRLSELIGMMVDDVNQRRQADQRSTAGPGCVAIDARSPKYDGGIITRVDAVSLGNRGQQKRAALLR